MSEGTRPNIDSRKQQNELTVIYPTLLDRKTRPDALPPGSGGSADILGQRAEADGTRLPDTPAPDAALSTGATEFLLGLAGPEL